MFLLQVWSINKRENSCIHFGFCSQAFWLCKGLLSHVFSYYFLNIYYSFIMWNFVVVNYMESLVIFVISVKRISLDELNVLMFLAVYDSVFAERSRQCNYTRERSRNVFFSTFDKAYSWSAFVKNRSWHFMPFVGGKLKDDVNLWFIVPNGLMF